jgi:hypothetical protein
VTAAHNKRPRIARLVYDSGQAGQTGGARSGISVERFMTFESGRYSIDVVEHGGSEEALRLFHGQVSLGPEDRPVHGARVVLDAGGSSTTDEHGQFAVLSRLGPDSEQRFRVETTECEVVLEVPCQEIHLD